MPKYHTTKQVADMLEVTDRYVRKMVIEKKLTAFRLGHRVRIPTEAVEKFMRERKIA